ncbi:MAG: PEGA domain-containing protein [Deltaproteobacteria bacterium]
MSAIFVLLCLSSAQPLAPWVALAAHAPGDDAAQAREAAGQLAQRPGIDAQAGPALRERLVGESRPVVDGAPPAAAALVREAGADFDSDNLLETIRDASGALEILEAAARSREAEALEREAQLLWGMALIDLGMVGLPAKAAIPSAARDAARGHLRWALAREPSLRPKGDRFTPKLREALEPERAALAGVPGATLSVAGPPGAEVYVDGLAQGQTPLALSGLGPRDAWVWIELAGRRSLAHRVSLRAGARAALAIDLDLEGRLDLSVPGEVALAQRPDDPEGEARLRRLAAASAAAGALAVERMGGGFELIAVSPATILRLPWPPGVRADDIAAKLVSLEGTRTVEGGASPQARSAPAAATSEEARAVVAPTGQASPWVWIAASALVVGVGIGGYAWLRAQSAAPAASPPNTVVFSSTGNP